MYGYGPGFDSIMLNGVGTSRSDASFALSKMPALPETPIRGASCPLVVDMQGCSVRRKQGREDEVMSS